MTVDGDHGNTTNVTNVDYYNKTVKLSLEIQANETVQGGVATHTTAFTLDEQL